MNQPQEKPEQQEGDEHRPTNPDDKSPDDHIIEKTLPTKPPGQKESE